jgi:hypothetical protein
MGALVFVPLEAPFEAVLFAAGAVRDAAHGDVLYSAAVCAAAMAFDMGKVYEKIGIVDKARNIHMLKSFPVNFFGVNVFAQVACGFYDGGADAFLGIAPLFRAALGNVMIREKTVAAMGLYEFRKEPHEYRRYGGVSDFRSYVDLNRNAFALYLVAEARCLKLPFQFSGKGLA